MPVIFTLIYLPNDVFNISASTCRLFPTVTELKKIVNELLKDDGKLIGLSFMDMFTKAGWAEKVDFDLIIDGTLIGVVKK